MHRFSKEMQELLQKNIKLSVNLIALLKMCLGVNVHVETYEKMLVGIVRLCQIINSQALMKRLESMMDKMAKLSKEIIP